MNILFVLYGDFSSNSANPLALYARELSQLGHSCAIAVPYTREKVNRKSTLPYRPILYSDALADPKAVFANGRPADVIHACTCRDLVRRFIISYMKLQPTPLVIYLEDNEPWIALRALGMDEESLNGYTEKEIAYRLSDHVLSHPLYWDSFVGLADAVAVIQGKLKFLVPPWVPCETVMIGVDFEFFSPRAPKGALRKKYGIKHDERVIVYHGGINQFVRPAIESLCQAIGIINQQGYPCRLLRTGLHALDFLKDLPPKTLSMISDLGMLPKNQLPDLLSLSDVFVQPGKIDPFEDLRLPGKIPEFFAMGRPVVMPDVNIAHLFRDGLNALLLKDGSAEEIAAKCIDLFSDSKRATRIGKAGRQLAKKYFEGKTQARRFEKVYKTACENFNHGLAHEIWQALDEQTPVTLRLARKLQLVTASGLKELDYHGGDFLREYARYIELMYKRTTGLESGLTRSHVEIDRLTQQIEEKDRKISALAEGPAYRNQLAVEREGRLSLMKHQIVELGNQVGYRTQQIAERDGQIGLLKEEIFERDRHIGHLQNVIVEGEGRIDQLNQEVTGREDLIRHLHQEVADRDGLVALFGQHVVDRDGQIVERDGKIHSLHQQLAHMSQQIAERDGQIAVLDQQVSEKVALIVEIIGSKSWKVTAPIRIFANQLRRARQMIKMLPSFVIGSGGIGKALQKTIGTLQEDGVSGVRNRVQDKIGGSGEITVPPTEQFDAATVDKNDYTEWVRRYDTLDDSMRLRLRDRLQMMKETPLISILMPTYNTGSQWLIEAIESVRKQIYPHWELCIADDASTDETIRPLLEKYSREEPRIKVTFREQNGHISAASNSALALATGEWVALLDHDDLLAEHALYYVAEALNHNPDIRLIYSDEDKIDEKGRRFQPYFKSDWNVDLFYSQNLISHLGIYRTDLVREIGGFRDGLDGSQDYDLALRMIERVDDHQIYHIPRVLYHWRIHDESTAQWLDAKPYAIVAGERALNEHFHRRGVGATAERMSFGYRVHYALPNSLPMVSLIIPTRNTVHLLRQCVDSVLTKTTYPNYEILIVDNGSDDPETLDYLQSLKSNARIRLLRSDGPFNYSALNNFSVTESRGDLVGLLNNDISVISPEWLSEMVSIALQPGVGAVGASLWYPNDTLQHGGVILGIGGCGSHSHKGFPKGCYGYFGRMGLISSFSAVTAACLIIKKSIFEEVGGLNETDLPVAFNDTDFCLRIREAGYRNVWTPYAELYHHESASRGSEDLPEKQIRFSREVNYMLKRWGHILIQDPAYNPNLTLNYEDFSLAWPPRVKPLSEP